MSAFVTYLNSIEDSIIEDIYDYEDRTGLHIQECANIILASYVVVLEEAAKC